MTTHFITFATNDYQLAARDLARSACEIGGFEKSTIFGLDSVDDGFKKRNADIFNYPSNKGIGYYIWKPYVVFHHILTVAENDLVCYCDALYLFKNNIIDDLDRWMAGNPIPLAIAENKPNEAAVPEAFVSKGDAFHLMNAQPVGNQAWAGFLSFRRNSLVTQFLGEWLARVQDVRVVSDSPSITANHPGFFANRYDQTVLSILRSDGESRSSTSPADLCKTTECRFNNGWIVERIAVVPFRHFISLGTQCQVAHALKVAGLRNAAFPFDWIVTPEWSAHAAIEDDFRDFFTLESLRPIRNDPRVYSVINPYGCIFQHEFHDVPTEETIGPHRARLNRRIERFREACSGLDPVLFVRKKVGAYEAISLRDLIAHRFPSLEFQLLCVNERAEEWRLDRIVNRRTMIAHTTDELDGISCNAFVEMLADFTSL